MPDVTGITALDVGIGLAFVYLLLSILCSALQEAIAGFVDLRARTLEKGLENLLEDRGARGDNGAPQPVRGYGDDSGPECAHLTKQLLSHGLVRTQYREPHWVPSLRRQRRGPSYIPAQTFAIALLDIVAPRDPSMAKSAVMPDVREKVSSAPIPAGTKDALQALALSASDREDLRKQLEEWFDSSMERVSGWYKRKAQIVVCGLALLVTIGLNVNTIAIAQRLVRDDTVRAAVVKHVTDTKLETTAAVDELLAQERKLAELGLPIGWHKTDGDPAKADLDDHFLRTAGGWLITFIMLSLGAPFWFNVVGKLTALRGGKPATPAPAT